MSMGFLRQEYWSGLPFPPPGDLPNPGTEPESPVSPALAGGFFTTEQPDVQPHYTDAKALAWIINDSYGAKSKSLFLVKNLLLVLTSQEHWILLTILS